MNTENVYSIAKKQYAAFGIDTDAAIDKALQVPISLHCWQADDNVGFEPREGVTSGGGILATGNHPGRARNGKETRADIAQSISLIPGVSRVNVHAYYAEFENGFVDRDGLTPAHFENWMAWAESLGIALDFNASFHAHPKADSGYTLSHEDEQIRAFWIGTRATRKAILYALLDPTAQLRSYEKEGKNAQRLALMEEFKSMPFGAVWDQLCEKAGVPVGSGWLSGMEAYEAAVLPLRK